MTATLLDVLMILSLGLLGGTGAGLLIGFLAGKQAHDWELMQKQDRITSFLLILISSVTISAVLGWYIFWFAGA